MSNQVVSIVSNKIDERRKTLLSNEPLERATMLQKFSTTLVFLLLLSSAVAEPCTQWERESSYNRLFDTESIITVKGTITEVSTYPLQNCGESGVQVMLKSDGKQLAVHLGPAWYIQNQGKQFNVGDKVTIKGSSIEFNGVPTVLALAVVMKKHMLVLRSASGAPVWAGWQSTR